MRVGYSDGMSAHGCLLTIYTRPILHSNEQKDTMAKIPTGCWGDWYIIHTTAPAFIAKWGMCSEDEAHAMGVGYGLGDGKSLGMMPAQPIGKAKVSNDDLLEWRLKGLAAVVQFIVARESVSDRE